ncbi:hypothetical protein SJAG_04560 [Schizosaccharomyces japonicus yFS275]|uniref:Uncharacterized protein n=1 Tax=Schizosaccharomyces japonicus (strain yFS275 / FY16936) TaxID=402676 RepID=B6K755_SCHJY|nr:hypothetical protein SJAG_04560 [Schizosaccharomyces japonicus yFS275]EEB09359.1 hypothetical protein SJAG_04560 [Schizosaccharomyces japonicus yFS275]
MEARLSSIIRQWPKDAARPWVSFPKMLQSSFQSRLQKMNPVEANEQLQSLENLVNNCYSKKYEPNPAILQPKFQPNYYEQILSIRPKKRRRYSWLGWFFRD